MGIMDLLRQKIKFKRVGHRFTAIAATPCQYDTSLEWATNLKLLCVFFCITLKIYASSKFWYFKLCSSAVACRNILQRGLQNLGTLDFWLITQMTDHTSSVLYLCCEWLFGLILKCICIVKDQFTLGKLHRESSTLPFFTRSSTLSEFLLISSFSFLWFYQSSNWIS